MSILPPRAAVVEDADWLIGTWSARKAYTFESQLGKREYLAWAKRALGPNWHCRVENDAAVLFTRLLSAEQQNLELRTETTDSPRIRVRVTFTVIPT